MQRNTTLSCLLSFASTKALESAGCWRSDARDPVPPSRRPLFQVFKGLESRTATPGGGRGLREGQKTAPWTQ